MKHVLMGVIGVALMANSATAADIAYPTKAAIPVAPAVPVFTWTGFYIGGNFGYGWGEGSTSWDNFLSYYFTGYDVYNHSGSSDPEGWIGGFQVGYNYQLSNNVVVGIEADFQFGSLDNTLDYYSAEVIPFAFNENYGSVDTEIKTFGTVRGRLGYAFDRFLPYFTGGLAWGHVKMSGEWSTYVNGVYQPGLAGGMSTSETLWGWTVGGGAEYALTNNWTVKAEYLYADLGDISWDGKSATNLDVTLQTLKLGVNYKF